MADKVVRTDGDIKVRVDKSGQLYWDFGVPTVPKAKSKGKGPKKRGY